MAEPLQARPPAWPDEAVAGPDPWVLRASRHLDTALAPASGALTAEGDQHDAQPDDLRARVVDLVPIAILCLDERGGALLVNAAWTNLTGRSAEAELGDGWLNAIPSYERAEVSACICEAVQEPRALTRDAWVDTVIGRRLVRFSGQPTIEPVGSSTYVLVASDVTEQVALEERLAHTAHHDSLTGLMNRGGFVESVEKLTVDAIRTGRINALLVLDLDGFKGINDAGGHGVGDQVLKLVAERIQDIVRPSDVVARLGDDEFAVVVVDVSTPAEAHALASRILRSVAEPMPIAGRDWQVGASIGISVTTDDSVSDLLARADASLYVAKARGKGRIVIENRHIGPVVPEPPSHTSGGPHIAKHAVTSARSAAKHVITSAAPTARPFHSVHFYRDADDLLPPMTGYVGAGLLNDGAVVVVARPSHRQLLNRRLGKDVLDGARASGRYVELDAAETVRRIMRNGYPDPDLFQMVAATPLLHMVKKYGQVRACGEMAGLLWSDGNVAAALRLEDLWNELQQRIGFPLLCSYPEVGQAGDGREHIVRRHSNSLTAGA